MNSGTAITTLEATTVHAVEQAAGVTISDRSDSAPVTSQTPCLFVIPAYNEEENIVRLLDDLAGRPYLFPPGSRVIVVDDGSHDATVQLVAAYEAPFDLQLLEFEHNQGPGGAFRAGFAAALDACEDDSWIVTLEADTTSDLDALPEMIAAAEGGADLVLADWRMVNVSAHRRMLSACAGFLVRRVLGLEAMTFSSFFRIYRSSTLRAAAVAYGDRLIQEPGFACKAEILGKLTARDARVAEVVVALDWGRRRGQSKMPVGRTMLAYWRMMLRARAQESA